ncbi:CDP-diacylglycerol--glycerol-3-phosphate 3-phosphatidyltransferase, partial [Streptomyces parvus]|nr:CDP-diacylglycerol--glycerol-3-phosphate 3-phosphatidyltransferase [Streptomyces parvus]
DVRGGVTDVRGAGADVRGTAEARDAAEAER